ncbi:DedA family protein [Halopseudomonas sabulinigri]|uniref:DedA family protein n=1 Tax=Halopseudomonas sabulinigri TaxID=472181 RepID=UPI00333E2CA1
MLVELTQWLAEHQQWLGLAIFLISFSESLAVAGLVVPGVFLLFAVSALAAGGGMPLTVAVIWAFSGAVLGDLISFFLGRYFHQNIRNFGPFKRNPQWIDGGERFFRRYGWLSVVLGRFIGPIRPIIPMVAGMFDMPAWRFLAINLVSALAWAPAYLIPGYTTGRAAQWTVPPFFWNQALSLLIGAIILIGCCLYVLKLQKRWSCLVAAAGCLLSLLALSMNQTALAIFDSTLIDSAAHLRLPGASDILILTPQVLLVAAPIIAALLLARRWNHAVMQVSALALALLMSWSIGLTGGASINALLTAILCALVVNCSRSQHFWVRSAWLLYLLPLLLLIASNVLEHRVLPPLEMLRSLLVGVSASLLACWLVERVSPMTPLAKPLRWVIASWPFIAAAWLLW